MDDPHNYLFIELDFGSFMRGREQQLSNDIGGIDGDRLLNTSIEDWVAYFLQEFIIDIPILKEDQIKVDSVETEKDVREDFGRYIRDRSRPFYIKGNKFYYYIPFEGSAELFRYHASTYSVNPPQGEISRDKLILSYFRTDHDAESVKTEFNKDLSEIKVALQRLSSDAAPFNSSLETKIRNLVEERKNKILEDRNMLSSLGFPLMRDDSFTKTYTVPMAPKKILSVPQPIDNTPFKPEPELDMKNYEEILSIISNMALVLERSPKAFKSMGEEDIRQQFLIPLNGQYRGQATGETFNFEGKTDILLRAEGKNIFIAECKFWKGPEVLTSTINQLLGYASWRDTKTAILLFNRNKNLSSVLEKISPTVKEHINFKKEVEYNSETGFRYILSHKDDPNRDLTLTILVFEVPVEK